MKKYFLLLSLLFFSLSAGHVEAACDPLGAELLLDGKLCCITGNSLRCGDKICKIDTQECVFSGDWTKEFSIKGDTVVRHTPNYIAFGLNTIVTSELTLKPPQGKETTLYNGVPHNGFTLRVGMTEKEFEEELTRSGLYPR